MYWEKEVINDLRRYNTYDITLKNLRNKIRELENFAGTGGASYNVPKVTDGSNRTEEKWTDLINRKDELTAQIEKIEHKKHIITSALNQLSEAEVKVITEFFIKGNRGTAAIAQLQSQINYSQTSIYALRAQALIHMAEILYGSCGKAKEKD